MKKRLTFIEVMTAFVIISLMASIMIAAARL